MRFVVSGIEQSHRYAAEHIIKLFFDDAHVQFEDMPADGGVSLLLEDGTTLRVPPPEPADGSAASHAPDDDGKARRRALSRALVAELQRHTGMEQPWGILTGVRPTKLMHGQRRSGATGGHALRELADEYGIAPDKGRLLDTIVDRQLAALPDLYAIGNEVSIYIGIPFCPTKCAYCTFPAYAINGRQGSVNSFLGGLHSEMEAVGRWLREHGVGITTIYYGGGTPTSITADEMDRLYEHMHNVFPGMERVREVTVEAGRPDTITPEKLRVLKRYNIDRISINPQSYTQRTLTAIGRHHTVEETIEKFHLARSMGMTNINMDLIIGLPGEGTVEFAHTLDETAKLLPESLTVHTLSFKRASEMTHNKEKYPVAGREEITRMMDMATSWCADRGYNPYYLYRQKNILGNLENVGYAQQDKESMYNIIIMEEMQSIIGLGCGASSKWVDPRTGAISRFANPKEPKAYNDNYERCTAAKLEALEELFGARASVAQA